MLYAITNFESNDFTALAGICLGFYIILRLYILSRDAFGGIKE